MFALYAVSSDPAEPDRGRIVITEGRVQQFARVFAKTWQRPPTAQELNGLIDAFVKEEIYYREALKLGLDRDDTLIRRRMQQKMEFLSEPPESELAASKQELEEFLASNRERFRVEPRVGFSQVFIDPKKGEGSSDQRAKLLLAKLMEKQIEGEISNIGDPTLLPMEIPLAPLSNTSRNFGESFAKQLAELPTGQWSGPIRSPYGLHLVRVSEFRDGYDPPLGQVRDAVEKEWRARRREEFKNEEYAKLRARYEVVLPAGEDRSSTAEGTK